MDARSKSQKSRDGFIIQADLTPGLVSEVRGRSPGEGKYRARLHASDIHVQGCCMRHLERISLNTCLLALGFQGVPCLFLFGRARVVFPVFPLVVKNRSHRVYACAFNAVRRKGWSFFFVFCFRMVDAAQARSEGPPVDS